MINKLAYISPLVLLIPFGCTKDGAKPIVVSPYTSKYNGKYSGVYWNGSWNPISQSSSSTQCVFEIKSGYDETHNITTIPTYTYIQFNENGYYQLPNLYGHIIVRNDSLIYSEFIHGGVANNGMKIFNGKKL